jgi:hypothetical protein
MSNPIIGIKIADGTYFPIVAKDDRIKKKVILTTVKDDQETVQIDLYQGEGREMTDAQYIGSLMIANIGHAPSGDPEIELRLGIDDQGNLLTKARDLKGTEEQSLSVNLQELPEGSTYDVPEFQMESAETESTESLSSLEMDAEPELEIPAETRAESPAPEPSPKEDSYETPYFSNGFTNEQLLRQEPEKSKLPLFVGIGAAVVALGILFFIFLVPKGPAEPAKPVLPVTQQTQPTAPAAPAAPAVTAAPAQTTTPAPAATPAQTSKPAAAPAQPATKLPTSKPADNAVSKPESLGVWYSLVRGDNLWNLSKSFYRNPRLFRKIADENALGNPDYVLEGQRLYIPDVETGRGR